MARIIVGGYMVRYPLGGNLSWALQYLVGFKALGHEVYFVEKFAYDNSCYDPLKQTMSDDCTYGIGVVQNLFAQHGMANQWCFVERGNTYHGLDKKAVEAVFASANLYIELGAHGAWDEESERVPQRVYIDVDPAYTQFKWFNQLHNGICIPAFHQYYTIGLNVGKPGNIVPTLGLQWKHIVNPVHTPLFSKNTTATNAPYATIMNWKSYENVKYKSTEYGQKDVEFEKFIDLPSRCKASFEVAVSGINVDKKDSLTKNGWKIEDAQKVTRSVKTFTDYVSQCKAEFSVCKHVYVATASAWFSDKSAAFLASGRPVIVQNTGFSDHFPTGKGLFAVKNAEEAKEAILMVEADYDLHANYARQLALDFFDTKVILKTFLREAGL